MAKKPAADTAKGVLALVKAGKKGEYSAGTGLYLSVNGVDAASWMMRYQLKGKRQRMGLGPYPAVSLADARAAVAEQKKLLAQEISPMAARQKARQKAAAKSVTFDDVARDLIEAQRGGWVDDKNAESWRSTLARYASPVIGHLPPAEITLEHIKQILNPIWATKTATAKKVQSRIENVLSVARVRGLIPEGAPNVATWRGWLAHFFPSPEDEAPTQHYPSLPYKQIGAFWRDLARHDSAAATALKLTILTCVRADEARGARWDEIDMDAKTWTVPAERMKGKKSRKIGKSHKVPLSQAALELLQSIPRTDTPLIFEGQKQGAPIGKRGMGRILAQMDAEQREQGKTGYLDEDGRCIVPHGFRSTFRNWAAEETEVDNIVPEMAMAHAIRSKVESSYRRGDLLERRRPLMEAWGAYVTSEPVNNVIPLRKKASA